MVSQEAFENFRLSFIKITQGVLTLVIRGV